MTHTLKIHFAITLTAFMLNPTAGNACDGFYMPSLEFPKEGTFVGFLKIKAGAKK